MHLKLWAPLDAYRSKSFAAELNKETLYLLTNGCVDPKCTTDQPIRIPNENIVDLAARGSVEPVWTTDLQFRVAGTPDSYPNDEYRVPPTPVAIVQLGPPGYQEYDRYQTVIGPATELSGFNVATTTSDNWELVLFRPRLSWIYIYAIAIAPLVFAIVIGDLLLAHRLTRPIEAATLYAGLAAAGLTVLPLRATLEPGDIQSFALTRVDLLLGAELGLIALLATVAHWKRLLVEDRRATTRLA